MQAIPLELVVVISILAVTLLLFAVGRWRYDIIAIVAALAVTMIGVVPAEQAFLGFGHPAVITVAAVLVISRGLAKSGFVDMISIWSSRLGNNTAIHIISLAGLVTALSAFINNIGALALLMPVAIRTAKKNGKSPSLLLMPLAFGSMLGGLITAVGTPPNIIIATLRAAYGIGPFLMFDFTPIGLGVAIAGLLFMSLIGWRLIPQRESRVSDTLSLVREYVTEVQVPEGSKMDGKRIRDLEAISEGDVAVVSFMRNGQRFLAPSSMRGLRAGDTLVINGAADELKILVDTAGLKLGTTPLEEDDLRSEDVSVLEVVITPNSPMEGKTARSLALRSSYGVNLLGISRQGRRLSARLGNIRLRIGDVLLLQVPTEDFHEKLSILGCLPLAEREILLGQRRKTYLAVGVFGGALVMSALGLLPVQISFSIAALAMVTLGVISATDAYRSIDWPVLVLIASMIPVAQAFETTGGAQLVADLILDVAGSASPILALVALILVTMLLSNLVNDAAMTVLMAPIAISIASQLGVSIDPFLMAVAIGASTAFLTPIGDQVNTLVMGPGGYEFGDYWRMGLPLQLIVIVVSIPIILWCWPF